MYFLCIHETMSLFLGFELRQFSSSNSIDSGYLVDTTPPAIVIFLFFFLKICRCFCHGLKICMCYGIFLKLFLLVFLRF